jgi:hypothetical protein
MIIQFTTGQGCSLRAFEEQVTPDAEASRLVREMRERRTALHAQTPVTAAATVHPATPVWRASGQARRRPAEQPPRAQVQRGSPRSGDAQLHSGAVAFGSR